MSGFSCGGVQAISAAKDPRVATAVFQNTGLFEAGGNTMPGMDVPKEALKSIHTPVIYILGGSTDIAYKNGMDDFQKINHVPDRGSQHRNRPWRNVFPAQWWSGRATVAVNWLQWQLRGDGKAKAMFVGKDCGLCKDPKWKLERKQIP